MPGARLPVLRFLSTGRANSVRNGGHLRPLGMKLASRSFLCCLAVLSGKGAPVSEVALQAKISGDQLLLSWSEGRPTFQLQGKANLADKWNNIGTPLDA